MIYWLTLLNLKKGSDGCDLSHDWTQNVESIRLALLFISCLCQFSRVGICHRQEPQAVLAPVSTENTRTRSPCNKIQIT